MAIKDGKFAVAIEWLEVARENALTDLQTSIVWIEFLLWNSIEAHNIQTEEDFVFGTNLSFCTTKIEYNSKESKSARRYANFKGTKETALEEFQYHALCSGKNFQNEKEKSMLFCWYEFKRHSVFPIGPVKMEFLHRNPDIVQIYEVLSENETETLISESVSHLLPSGVQDNEPGEVPGTFEIGAIVDDEKRTSMNAWLSDTGPIRGINRRIERIVGLHVVENFSAELLQVASYAFAGFYRPHNDESKWRSYEGHRIATFMLYLNNVEAGGHTAFPFLGFAAKPVAGSGIFWYNLYSDGETDQLTMHGACPVLYGEKWIATKWIWIGDQFRLRKCHLEPSQRHPVPVNDKILPTISTVLNERRGTNRYRTSEEELLKQKCILSMDEG